MTITRPMQFKKIIRFTEKRRRQLVEEYVSWGPARLASYYNDMGQNERKFVDQEVMPKASEDDKKKFEFYKTHPIELGEALIGLEQEIQT